LKRLHAVRRDVLKAPLYLTKVRVETLSLKVRVRTLVLTTEAETKTRKKPLEAA
jgi:hypothetical protein